MTAQNLEYTAEGRTFGGHLVHDEARAGRRAGVLVCHEGAGLGEHVRERARRLAELGYVACAPDLFGQPFESREQGVAAIMALVRSPTAMRDRLAAALDKLKSLPTVDPARTAAIGFCFGGWAALELARGGADVDCVVSFHGGLHTAAPAQPGEVRAKILVCTGVEDPHVPADQRAGFEAEMIRSQADWQMHIHAHALHGFTDSRLDPATSPGSAYNALADARSWAAMRALFDEALGAI